MSKVVAGITPEQYLAFLYDALSLHPGSLLAHAFGYELMCFSAHEKKCTLKEVIFCRHHPPLLKDVLSEMAPLRSVQPYGAALSPPHHFLLFT